MRISGSIIERGIHYMSLLDFLEKHYPHLFEKPWVRKTILIILTVSAILATLGGAIAVMNYLDIDHKKFVKNLISESFPRFYRCNGFDGITGRVILPPGYENDLSNISIDVVSSGKAKDLNEKCRYTLEVNNFIFKQEMKACPSNKELEFDLVKGADKYRIYPNPIAVCDTDHDLKLLLK